MRRSLVLSSTFPPLVGGVECYIYNICSLLPAQQVVVCAPHMAGDAEFDAYSPVRTVRVPEALFSAYWWGRRGRALALGQLSLLCLREGIEVLQASRTFPEGIMAWMLKQVWGIPYLVYTYGLDFLEPMRNDWGQLYGRRILTSAAHLISCSHFTGEQLLQFGVAPHKITPINPGVDLHRFRPGTADEIERTEQRLGLHNKRIILTVGRLVTRKGHDKVIESLPLVLQEVPTAVYLIVGDGPIRNELARLVQAHGLEEHVVFAGRVMEQDLPTYYQIADLLVMPSREIEGDVEGFGIVFIEASACKVPVVGGASGGIEDAIVHGETGFLVDPLSVDEIAQAIITLLKDDDLAQAMGKAGRARAERDFSWERVVAQVSSIIEGLEQTTSLSSQIMNPRTLPRIISTVIRRD